MGEIVHNSRANNKTPVARRRRQSDANFLHPFHFLKNVVKYEVQLRRDYDIITRRLLLIFFLGFGAGQVAMAGGLLNRMGFTPAGGIINQSFLANISRPFSWFSISEKVVLFAGGSGLSVFQQQQQQC